MGDKNNKILSWERFFDWVDRVHAVSPWLSRQMVRRASEWPFWYSGVTIRDWEGGRVKVHLPRQFRNEIDGEISHGHLLLAAELCVRLALLRYCQEFPFQYHLRRSWIEVNRPLNESVDLGFTLSPANWEELRLEMAKSTRTETEFVLTAQTSAGLAAASISLQVAFELEKFLSA